MQTKNEIITTLTHSELTFIKELTKQNFKSEKSCNNLRIKEKIYAICKKLNVCSFEEVVRKIDFYKMIDLKLSEDYKIYINNYSREKFSLLSYIRLIMINVAQNTSDLFYNFSYHANYLNEPEKQAEVEKFIEIINKDQHTLNSFNQVQHLINLVNVKHDFEQMYSLIFELNDEGYENAAECVVEKFNSYAIKYLFITRILIDNAFPLNIRRTLSPEERELVKFLLSSGDEIDFMQQKNIAPIIFKEKLNSIIHAYDASSVQEMLLYAQLESTLAESSLIYNYSWLNLRAKMLIANWENVLKLTQKEQHIILNNLKERIKICLADPIFSAKIRTKVDQKLVDFTDCDFKIENKMFYLKEWFLDEIDNLKILSKLQTLLYEVDNIVPYTSVVTID